MKYFIFYKINNKNMNTNKREETEVDREQRIALNKLRNTRCQCCNSNPIDDTFGEWYNNKWWCYDHADILFKKYEVKDLHTLYKK